MKEKFLLIANCCAHQVHYIFLSPRVYSNVREAYISIKSIIIKKRVLKSLEAHLNFSVRSSDIQWMCNVKGIFEFCQLLEEYFWEEGVGNFCKKFNFKRFFKLKENLNYFSNSINFLNLFVEVSNPSLYGEEFLSPLTMNMA